MKHTTTAAALLCAGAALTHAQIYSAPSEFSDPVEEVCNPNNSSGRPDFNAPCNAVKAIEYQCIYGPDYLAQAFVFSSGGGSYNRKLHKRQSDGDDGDSALQMQSNSTQRTCICESQFFDQVNGCAACYKAHGNPGDFDESIVDDSAIASLSSAYCAASATPSAGLADFLLSWADSYNASHPATGSATASMSDPIGNKTAVSLYYTPSVTGSAAWIVAEATSGASSGMGSFASENTVSGMIVPTASANNDAAQTTGSGSSSSTSSGGAAVATAAGMGMLGLAGIVAML